MGFVLSLTITVLVADASLPAASTQEYDTAYVPRADVSTLPVLTGLILPSTLSTHTAPASTYESPTSRTMELCPLSVIMGFVLSLTITVLVADAVFLAISVHEYDTRYVPGTDVFTELDVTTARGFPA